MSKEAHLQAIARYGAAWHETDPARRRALVAEMFAENGVFEDPLDHVTGREALEAHMARFHQQRPGARFEVTSPIDIHHRRHRFTWRMITPDGKVAVEATNFGTVDASGRLLEMVDFFDRVATS